MYLFLKKSYLNRVSFDRSALVKRTVFFLFSVCKGNSIFRSRQGLRKFGSEKILSSFAVRFFPLEPLTALRVPLLEWHGKGKKKCVGYAGGKRVCIPMRCVYIARSVLVGHFSPFSLCSKGFFAYLRKHGSKAHRKDNFPLYST